MQIRRLVTMVGLLGVSLAMPAIVFGQSSKPTPTPTAGPAAPEFKLIAGQGHFPPQSRLSFLDNVVNNVKLFFKFSQDAKLIKRMDIADKKIVHMKLSVEENNNLDHVTQASKDYKSQINAVDTVVKQKKVSDTMKQTLRDRVRDQDAAFVYLFYVSNDKTNPVLKDAWSQLQNLKADLK